MAKNINDAANSTGNTPRQQTGVPEGFQRETFYTSIETMDKVRDIAYWDRLLIKDAINAALDQYVDAWEKANGPVKPRPQEVKERERLRSSKVGRPGGSKNKPEAS